MPKTQKLSTIQNKICQLCVSHHLFSSQIEMTMLSCHHTTASLPHTLQALQLLAPSVLGTTCHNDHHLPFVKEVTDTEMGHLFEHLILDYLAHSEPANLKTDRIYKGVTEWNWNVNPMGTFSITISVGRKEQKRLQQAIAWSCDVLQKLFEQQEEIVPELSSSVVSHSTETVFAASV
jgi:hypothetical protein